MNIVIINYDFSKQKSYYEDLAKLGTIKICLNIKTNTEFLEAVKDADIVLISVFKLTAEIITKLSESVKLIAILATGYDNVDLNATSRRNIKVCNVPSYGANSVAQLAMMHILNCATQFTNHIDNFNKNGWVSGNLVHQHKMHELAGKTLGIVGFGAIGRALAQFGSGFAMRVLVFNRTPITLNTIEYTSSLLDIARQSDFISLHLALNVQTKDIISRDFFANMKQSAFLINTARGELVDEEALITALQSKQIAGAGLDVLSLEPPIPENPILHMNNVCITPHIAWATIEAEQRCLAITIQNLQCFINGVPQNIVST